jgi:hypothetical protein
VVPDIEAGNMLVKQLEYLADAQLAGIVLGAHVPIILTSRADNPLGRIWLPVRSRYCWRAATSECHTERSYRHAAVS